MTSSKAAGKPPKKLVYFSLLIPLLVSLVSPVTHVTAAPPLPPVNAQDADASGLEETFSNMFYSFLYWVSWLNPSRHLPDPAEAAAVIAGVLPVSAATGSAQAQASQGSSQPEGSNPDPEAKPGTYLVADSVTLTPILYPAAYPISREHYWPYGAYFVPHTEYNLESYQDFYATWSYPNYPYYVSNYTAPYYPYYYRGYPAYYPYYAAYPYYTGYPSTGYPYYGYPYIGYPYYAGYPYAGYPYFGYGYPYSLYPYYVGYPYYRGYPYAGYPYYAYPLASYPYAYGYHYYPYYAGAYALGFPSYYHYHYGLAVVTPAPVGYTYKIIGNPYLQSSYVKVPVTGEAPVVPAAPAPAPEPTIPSYPGIHYSDYFHLRAGETVEIVIKAAAPVNACVKGCDEFPGGVNLFIIGLLTPGGEDEEVNGWITSCRLDRVLAGWEARMLFTARKDGRYHLFFANESGDVCHLSYFVKLSS